MRRILIVALIIAPLAGWSQASGLTDCREDTLYHQLDFWLGTWTIYNLDSAVLGTNFIKKALDGCAVEEHWQNSKGGKGYSLFYVDQIHRKLKQVWVTDQAHRPGGQKEKQLVRKLANGTLIFEGAYLTEDGTEVKDRTLLRPLSDRSVTQIIETSTDGGATWQKQFIGLYEKQE